MIHYTNDNPIKNFHSVLKSTSCLLFSISSQKTMTTHLYKRLKRWTKKKESYFEAGGLTEVSALDFSDGPRFDFSEAWLAGVVGPTEVWSLSLRSIGDSVASVSGNKERTRRKKRTKNEKEEITKIYNENETKAYEISF